MSPNFILNHMIKQSGYFSLKGESKTILPVIKDKLPKVNTLYKHIIVELYSTERENISLAFILGSFSIRFFAFLFFKRVAKLSISYIKTLNLTSYSTSITEARFDLDLRAGKQPKIMANFFGCSYVFSFLFPSPFLTGYCWTGCSFFFFFLFFFVFPFAGAAVMGVREVSLKGEIESGVSGPTV